MNRVPGYALLCIALLVSAATPAQEKIRVVGVLSASAGPGASATIESFRRGMSELGWIDGKNLRVEYRWGAGKAENLAEFAAELVRMKVEVIVASATPSIAAAKAATTTIPIVMGTAADAEGSGFVANLARPGGNITGVSQMLPALSGKRLELLKEIVPRMNRVAYLGWAADPAHKLFLRQTQDAGAHLKVSIQPAIISNAGELPAAFAAMNKERAQAVIVQPLFNNNLGLGTQIADLAVKHKLPSISDGNSFADGGGLIFYGPDGQAIYSRIASYVDRILRGGNPAEMAVEQPQKFQFVVNMKTAKSLGIKMPQTILLRADRVIE